jgi:hypothetical protein
MSSDIVLSAAEVNALHRVRSGLANFLPSAHRLRLASLGLITVNGGGRLKLTQSGKERLAEESGSKSNGRTGDARAVHP